MRVLLIALTLAIAGCSGVPLVNVFKPYKIDIQQGNYVDQETVAKLQAGMTRSQVRYLLGTPLVADTFHAERWDYVYLFNKAGTVTEYRRVILLFKDDKLERIEGDVVPAAAAPAAKPAAKPAAPAAPVPKP